MAASAPAPRIVVHHLVRQFLLPHRHGLRVLHNKASPPHSHWLRCSAATLATNPSSISSSTERAKKNGNVHREWKDQKKEIMKDIGPILLQAKDMLHSPRYLDGERLTVEDEKMVVEKLLPYYPEIEDEIGCGIEFIMVDHHPEFQQSRCLFVVRTDCIRIDFSYHECLRKYIRDKYPTHAERFIRERFIHRKRRVRI